MVFVSVEFSCTFGIEEIIAGDELKDHTSEAPDISSAVISSANNNLQQIRAEIRQSATDILIIKDR